MSFFDAVKQDSQAKSNGDVVGGFVVRESNAYKVEILNVFAKPSEGGALGITIETKLLDLPNTPKYTETIYITNKQGATSYPNKKTNEPMELPGYTVFRELYEVITGKQLDLKNLKTEERTVEMYSAKVKGKAMTRVDGIPELEGKQAIFGIVKERKNKQEKSGNKYVPTAEAVESNLIDKVFNATTLCTASEIKANVPQGLFITTWLNSRKDKVIDRYVKVNDDIFGENTSKDSVETLASGADESSTQLFD